MYVFILNISYISSFFVCPVLYSFEFVLLVLLLLLSIYLLAPEEDSSSKALVYYRFLVFRRRVHFPRSVLFFQPHEQLFTQTESLLGKRGGGAVSCKLSA